jgi:hypothetical protein
MRTHSGRLPHPLALVPHEQAEDRGDDEAKEHLGVDVGRQCVHGFTSRLGFTSQPHFQIA